MNVEKKDPKEVTLEELFLGTHNRTSDPHQKSLLTRAYTLCSALPAKTVDDLLKFDLVIRSGGMHVVVLKENPEITYTHGAGKKVFETIQHRLRTLGIEMPLVDLWERKKTPSFRNLRIPKSTFDLLIKHEQETGEAPNNLILRVLEGRKK